jgi:hypothetical protein
VIVGEDVGAPWHGRPESGRRRTGDPLQLDGHLGARQERAHGVERGRLAERDQHALLLQLELERRREHPRQGRDDGLGERAVAARGVDVHRQQAVGCEPRPRRLEELGGQAVEGRVGAAGEDIHLDDVEGVTPPPQERPGVLEADLEVGPALETQILVGHLHDEGVDLDRGDVRSGIEAPVGPDGGPAAHPEDQDSPALGEQRPEVEDVVVAAREQPMPEADRMRALAGVVQAEQPVFALGLDDDGVVGRLSGEEAAGDEGRVGDEEGKARHGQGESRAPGSRSRPGEPRDAQRHQGHEEDPQGVAAAVVRDPPECGDEGAGEAARGGEGEDAPGRHPQRGELSLQLDHERRDRAQHDHRRAEERGGRDDRAERGAQPLRCVEHGTCHEEIGGYPGGARKEEAKDPTRPRAPVGERAAGEVPEGQRGHDRAEEPAPHVDRGAEAGGEEPQAHELEPHDGEPRHQGSQEQHEPLHAYLVRRRPAAAELRCPWEHYDLRTRRPGQASAGSARPRRSHFGFVVTYLMVLPSKTAW